MVAVNVVNGMRDMVQVRISTTSGILHWEKSGSREIWHNAGSVDVLKTEVRAVK